MGPLSRARKARAGRRTVSPGKRILLALTVLGLHPTLEGDTLILPASSDGFIRESQDATETKNLTNWTWLLGETRTVNDRLHGLLAFDLSDPVLDNATINKATLELSIANRDTSGGGSVSSLESIQLHPLVTDFDEGEVTWYQRKEGIFWNQAGGDYNPEIAKAQVNPAWVNAGDKITFSSADLTTTVRNSTGKTFSLLTRLGTYNGSRSILRIASRHGDNPPILFIDYTPGPPVGTSTATPLPGHPERPASPRYSVTVDHQSVPVKAERYDFDVALFTLDEGPAEVEISVADGFSGYTLKPSRHNLTVNRSGQELRFTLDSPLKLVLQIPGRTPLAIIATPPVIDPPLPGDPKVVYFGAGTTNAGVIKPQSGETLYFAPGSLVKGRIEIKGVENVRVIGDGFLETEGYAVHADRTHGILVEDSNNILIEGISIRNYHTWWQTLTLNSTEVTFAHLNIFGKGPNTDGVDIDAVKDFVVRDTFIRGEDDGLGWHSLDAETNGEMITERVLAENIVIWNSWLGNGVRIGASMEAQLWRDITLRNLDILYHAGSGLYSDYSDWAWMEDLTFENINIEREKSPINLRILETHYSNQTGFLQQRGFINRLLFKNVTMNGGTIRLEGAGAANRIDHVRFNNCSNMGLPLTSLDQLEFNEYVTDIQFNTPLPQNFEVDPGIFEAEDLDSQTNQRPQFITENPESTQDRHRVFRATSLGDYIEHFVDLPEEENYHLKVTLYCTPNSGIARLSVNGTTVGQEIDAYSPEPGYSEFDLGIISIPAGASSLRLTVTGKHAASSGYDLEIDRFKILSRLQSWRDYHFKTTANRGEASNGYDYDEDGVANLLEFATHHSPTQPSPPPLLTFFNPETQGLGFQFTRLSPAPVNYACQASEDLREWHTISSLSRGSDNWNGPAFVKETKIDDQTKRVTIEDSLSQNSATLFLRLQVSSN